VISSSDDQKKRLRAEARARRAEAAATSGPLASEQLAAHFMHSVLKKDGRLAGDHAIAGYWPMRDEMDPLPLLDRLAQRGYALALPVVTARNAPLAFRRWSSGDPLEPGEFGTRHPPATAATVTPTIVLVPLLAFDDVGHRLGYGGGHYDRPLAQLRGERPVIAVGIAYDAQRMHEVPVHDDDQRLDWVVTEHAAQRFP
jgi:5-formyltetrahydrofolate cyclo-ligase